MLEAANRELMEEVGYGAKRFDFLSKLTMAPSYFSSKMNIVLAHDLYPQSTEGDEPEPTAGALADRRHDGAAGGTGFS